MLIFSPNCVCGYVYRDILKIRYNHPFVWTLFEPDEFIDFVDNLDLIDYDKFQLCDNYKSLSYLEVKFGNKYNLKLWHAYYNPKFNKPTILNNNVYYNKIDKYIKDKYQIRKQRLKNALNDKEDIVILYYAPNLRCTRLNELPDIVYKKKYKTIIFTNENIVENQYCIKLNVDDNWPNNPGAWHDGFFGKYGNFLMEFLKGK